MNTQQMNMAMANAGGPVGGTPLMNSVSQRGGMSSPRSRIELINTYIYDYFLRHELWDIARSMKIQHEKNPMTFPLLFGDGKPSPSSGDVNGVDSMDTDKKGFNKPEDLPEAGNKIGTAETCFLADWWAQFWDMFDMQRRQEKSGALGQYIHTTQNQQRARQERQNQMMQNDPNRQMMMMRNMQNMQQNGMGPNNLQKAAMMNNGTNMTPQQQQQMLNMRMQQAKMNNMQRDGQNMNMGEQRSQSPAGAENAPSPKRQRMDGNFNGQMGPAGRGQGVPGQPQGNMQGGPTAPMLLQNGLNAEQLALQQKQQFEGMNPGGQGSPMAQPNADGGNHALQDYQMQLMLLEQQNKKRLLMARQEQDNMSHPPGSGPMPGQGFVAPAMSPSGSRAGPSPNPPDQMKRNTPKMPQGALPNSPADPNLQGNRGSPAPNFDPSLGTPGMTNQFYPNMMQGGNMGRPPSSHPQANMPMNAQQMEQMRRAGQLPNGQMFPQGGPMMQNPQQGGQPGQPGQQPPMGTPRQQPGNMPPPPAPTAGGEQGRTNPPSPSQNAQPPTPSQAAKNLPKGNKKNEKAATKKAANKAKNQNTAGATPASEAEPPTPTPSTPITPMHPNSFNGGQKNGAAPMPGAVPGAQQPNPAAQAPAPGPGLDPGAAPFGDLGADTFGNLDLANFDTGDVLENFDFDSFLHTDDSSNAFNFEGMGFTDGVEAGEGV